MKTTIKLTTLFLMTLVVALSSCTKDGEIGPMGPAGANGIDGINGTNGTNGTDGEDGNANVIASEWFGPDGQTFITNGYTSYAEFDKDISEVDPAIYDSGVVLVYAKFSNFVPEVWPTDHSALLPLTISGGTTDYFYTFYHTATNLKVRLRREGPQPTWTFSPQSRFRYVIIPSGTTGRAQQPNFHKMTYEEVMDYFGLDY